MNTTEKQPVAEQPTEDKSLDVSDNTATESPASSTNNAENNLDKKVNIEMTLTSPNCPVAESLPNMVKENILKVSGVEDVDLKLVWDPPWRKDKMSEAAKLELNL